MPTAEKRSQEDTGFERFQAVKRNGKRTPPRGPFPGSIIRQRLWTGKLLKSRAFLWIQRLRESWDSVSIRSK